MKAIGVDCRFSEDGTVDVRRIYLDRSWLSVGQGRQWLDGDGRHVLIMLPDDQVREICLRSVTMAWELTPAPYQETNLL